jgi:hypothetical protein
MIYYIINFIFSKYKMQDGSGTFLREPGLEPPKFRKLLQEVGDEKINKLVLWREPISVNSMLKFLKLNKSFDDLFHLALNLSDKYNLDKQSVLTFERGKPKGETLEIPVSKDITIREMIEKTKKRMGDNAYSSYSVRNNCQQFLLNVLSANGLMTTEARKFIEQDVEKILQDLPKYSEVVANFFTGAQAVANRLIEGEGSTKMYNYQLHESKCKF